ncbi:hypothetical protein [Streptomyces sp. NPDC054783]
MGVLSSLPSAAIELVEGASRRVYAGYERDLEAPADEIVPQNVLADATTVSARTLPVGKFRGGPG